jgi:ATP/maltotriose-dependent transcriptional regulator MalT
MVDLTTRELEIVEGLAHGYFERDLAKKIFMSYPTLKGHLQKIRVKLQIPKDVNSRSYLTRYWITEHEFKQR